MDKKQAAEWIAANGTDDLSGQHTLEYMVERIHNKADWPYSHIKTALNEVLDVVAQSNNKSLIAAANELADAMPDVVRVGDTAYWVSDVEDIVSEFTNADA